LDFDKSDETRTPDKTKVDVIHANGQTVARLMMEPGWTWEECVKPVVGGDSCQVPHIGYVEQGSIKITSDDGEVMEFRAGDVYHLEPGHVAEVTSDEAFIAYEFDSEAAEKYAAT